MNATVLSAVLGILLAGAAHSVAGSPVYKWVDEAGVVNYSADPPAGRGIKASVVDSTRSKLSSYDPVSAGLDPNSQLRRDSENLRHRAEQLQSRLDELSYARRSAADAAEQAKRHRLEQCQLQRRVDCDDDYQDIGYPRVALVSRLAFLPVPPVVHVVATRTATFGGHAFRHSGGARRLR